MKLDYLDGFRMKRAVIAGARRVILMQEGLNRINVFPVPDNDTGTNMALTMQCIAEGAIDCRRNGLAEMSRCVADSALMGARGNSGAILAQFFEGLAERFQGRRRASLQQFGEAVIGARDSSYDALNEPREGTILTVIHDWAERIRHHCHHSQDFADLLKEGLHEAERSLKATPMKLKLLAKAGVVDAGGQGFVHMLEGINQFLQSGKIERAVGIGGSKATKAKIEEAPHEIKFQFCTECLVEGDGIARGQLRNNLGNHGNSLIVAGSASKVRIHIHTNEPQKVFEIAGEYGRVSKQKYDDMRLQHVKAHGAAIQAKIGLVTDSSCDLPPEFIIRHNIQVVPVQLSFGSKTFVDRITITPKEFYHLLGKSKQYPKTSQPTPGDFRNTYQQALDHYEQMLSISLSGAVSGTLQAAQRGARATSEDRITVVDSRTTSVALGLIVAEAAQAIEQGCTLDEVKKKTDIAIENARFFITFATVEYLMKGGRLSRTRGFLAKGLDLKPILMLNSKGELETIAQTRGRGAALKKLMEIVSKEAAGKRNLRFSIAHANAPKRAAWLKREIKRRFEVRDMIITNVSPALGAHAGPGAAGVAFLGD